MELTENKFANLRQDFPILANSDLVYLDNASTSQKPQQVLNAISHYYQHDCANVHRGVHRLADASTEVFEKSRETVSSFFGAKPEELIFTRNATEALNGVVYGWADHNLREGDVILSSILEHHSNLVVWQQVCQRTGAELRLAGVTEDGQLDIADFEEKLVKFKDKVKLVSLVHVSNTTGAVTPIAKVVQLIKGLGLEKPPRLVVDGAQSAPHLPINFSGSPRLEKTLTARSGSVNSSPTIPLGADFYAFSGHKMLGPMGSGGLLVRKEILESGEMRPWLFGGGMIAEVYEDKTVFSSDTRDRFTPGTPDVASAVGLASACDYLAKLGSRDIVAHDQELVEYALSVLAKDPHIRVVGPTNQNQAISPQHLKSDEQVIRSGSVAFVYEKVHAHDVAQILDSTGVAVRSGHHCTMPLHTAMGLVATTRASFQVYNTKEDIDALMIGLEKVAKVFKDV